MLGTSNLQLSVLTQYFEPNSCICHHVTDLRRSDTSRMFWPAFSGFVYRSALSMTALLTFRGLTGLRGEAPLYLSEKLVRVADVSSRRRLWSSSTSQLMVPRYRLSTIGSRSFYVAGPIIWNQLPSDAAFSSYLSECKRKLKPHLFRFSYPNNV